MVPDPLDPADELGGDAHERGDVDRPPQVEVGPAVLGRRGVAGRDLVQDDQVVVAARLWQGLHLPDQGL